MTAAFLALARWNAGLVSRRATYAVKAGCGSIIHGNGDGSALQVIGQATLSADTLQEYDDNFDPLPDSQPTQLAAAGDAIGYQDSYPDLIGIATSGGATHLNYYSQGASTRSTSRRPWTSTLPPAAPTGRTGPSPPPRPPPASTCSCATRAPARCTCGVTWT